MAEINEKPSRSEERKQLAADLQSRSVLLFVTLTSIGDAVITTDGSSSITFLNPVAEKLTGWSLEEAVGMDIETAFSLVNETTGQLVPSSAKEAMQSISKVILESDVLLVRKDGSRVPIDDSAAPIVDMDGNVLGAVVVFRDITEKKRSQQVIKYRSELDRMAARISTAFITSPVSEVDEGIRSALKEIGEFLQADRSYVFLFSDDGTSLVNMYAWHSDGIEPPQWKTAPVSIAPYWLDQIRNRHYIHVSDIDEIPYDALVERAFWETAGIKTLISVPMSQEDRVLGLVGVDSVTESKHWTEDIIDLFFVIGNVFASAMGRRDALQKLEAAREQEVLTGSRIQQALLIGEPPVVFGDFQLAALTIPSSKIDGDFYDVLLHPNRVMDVLFGDVMGKGVPAALLAAGSKTEFLRSLSNLLTSSRRGVIPQPQDIVNSVHSVLTPQLLALDSFVTLSYVRFDPTKGKLTLVDCGNTRLLRCRGEDGSMEYLSGFNVPLGFAINELYIQADYPIESGDVFMFYSDGASEARNPQGEMFGLQRLCNLIEQHRQQTPQEIVDALQSEVTAFVGRCELSDDFTCVVVKVVPELALGMLPAVEELQVTSNFAELAIIRDFLRDFCARREACTFTGNELHLLELATTEVASNIMKHAYRRLEEQPIWVRIELAASAIKIRMIHKGEPFVGPDHVSIPSLDEARESGFGLFIINHSVDAIEYGTDSEGKQYIELVKLLRKQGE